MNYEFAVQISWFLHDLQHQSIIAISRISPTLVMVVGTVSSWRFSRRYSALVKPSSLVFRGLHSSLCGYDYGLCNSQKLPEEAFTGVALFSLFKGKIILTSILCLPVNGNLFAITWHPRHPYEFITPWYLSSLYPYKKFLSKILFICYYFICSFIFY